MVTVNVCDFTPTLVSKDCFELLLFRDNRCYSHIQANFLRLGLNKTAVLPLIPTSCAPTLEHRFSKMVCLELLSARVLRKSRTLMYRCVLRSLLASSIMLSDTPLFPIRSIAGSCHAMPTLTGSKSDFPVI